MTSAGGGGGSAHPVPFFKYNEQESNRKEANQ